MTALGISAFIAGIVFDRVMTWLWAHREACDE